MSVGHAARILEENGIPTVVIAIEAFQETLNSMKIPRVLFTPFPMGRPLGFPGDKKQHRQVVKAALDLLKEAEEVMTTQTLSERYFKTTKA